MKEKHTQEPQYNTCMELLQQQGHESLGIMSGYGWYDDPKRLTFTLARYKFVAKMFAGRTHVLEVGCGDAFASRIVAQEVHQLTATDFDPVFIQDARKRMSTKWNFNCFTHDLLKGPVPGSFDGVYALDVLEHISADNEDAFLNNMLASLHPDGSAILGMPSLESQKYASPLSKKGHVNCKTHPDFRHLMEKHFKNVFMFSMNDEVIHTGYHKMAHYLIALCCGKIKNHDK
jgi:2-polyprenyl-3-methyl-5-hydroxy-6-metoxy-1,4-benzoquinol methylase